MRHCLPISLLALAAAMFVCAPAQARPRDAVMSAAFRCAAIGSSRMWLDCYYGAAQPARAALGLAPAPAAQVQLSRTAPATAEGPVSDGPIRDQVMRAAFDCNGLAQTRDWLTCYYAAAQPMRARLGLAPAPQAAPRPSGTRPVARPAPPPGGAAAPGSTDGDTRVRLASYSFDRQGMFTVTLANGQVWTQRPDDVTYARWKGPPASHVVSVWGGAMGNWKLEDEHDHAVYSVKPGP